MCVMYVTFDIRMRIKVQLLLALYSYITTMTFPAYAYTFLNMRMCLVIKCIPQPLVTNLCMMVGLVITCRKQDGL